MSERQAPDLEDQPFTGDAVWSPAGLDDRGVRFQGIRFECRELPAPDEYLRFRELSYLARLISLHVRCSGYRLTDPPAVLCRQLAWFLNERLSVVEQAYWEWMRFDRPTEPGEQITLTISEEAA